MDARRHLAGVLTVAMVSFVLVGADASPGPAVTAEPATASAPGAGAHKAAPSAMGAIQERTEGLGLEFLAAPADGGDRTGPQADEALLTWDASADFLAPPASANPSPDRYGNPGVWSYLASTSLDHNPAAYVLMPNFTTPSGHAHWSYPYDLYYLIENQPADGTLLMSPGAGRLAIVGWTSPVTGEVNVQGALNGGNPPCKALGTGVIFSIDQGSHILGRMIIASQEGQQFALTTAVKRGDSLYFVLDPGLETACDGMLLNVVVTGKGSAPNTSFADG